MKPPKLYKLCHYNDGRYIVIIMIDIVRWCYIVVQVMTKITKAGRPVQYLQKYLKDWEHNPEFRGNATLLFY